LRGVAGRSISLTLFPYNGRAMCDLWRRFWRLNGFKKWLALEAAVTLVATRTGLRLIGFRNLQKILIFSTPSPKTEPESGTNDKTNAVRAIAQIETSVARHIFLRGNCLENSLALWALLRMHGVRSELKFGGRKDAESFAAHAWVQYRETVLTDANGEYFDFVPFDSPLAGPETQAH
jgi:hypothetical protein